MLKAPKPQEMHRYKKRHSPPTRLRTLSDTSEKIEKLSRFPSPMPQDSVFEPLGHGVDIEKVEV